MKRIVAFFIMMFIAVAQWIEAPCQKNMTVADYFMLYRPGSISQIKGGWFARGISDNYDLPVTMDIKNGYLVWEDPGTGGGTLTTEAALFVRADKEVILAVCKREFDGVGVSSSVEFFHYTGGKMAAADKKIFPVVTADSFKLAKISRSSYDQYASYVSELTPIYLLPRYGTSIEVQLNTNRIGYLTSQLTDQKEAARIQKFVKESFYGKIYFDFDAKTGTFKPGKKQ